jgi:hypothetical protein
MGDSVDWQKERDEWLAHLDRLYSKVESFLEKYLSSGQIRLEYRQIGLNEEGIGSYIARQMILWIGRQEVDLVPIGTFFIGAKGRVDVIGPAGKAELLLVDRKRDSWRPKVIVTVGVGERVPVVTSEPRPEIEWEWRILTRPPEKKSLEITQENLFQLIMEIANG